MTSNYQSMNFLLTIQLCFDFLGDTVAQQDFLLTLFPVLL